MNAPGKKRRALILDDEKINRFLLRTILEQEQWDVTEAQNGLQAYDLIAKGGFDLLISDVHVPELNARELISKLTQDGVSMPPLFIVSGDTNALATWDGAMREKVLYLFEKPLELPELIHALRSMAATN
jgi:CheY-like chemotaxis protein